MSDFLMIGGTRVPIAAPSGADEEYQERGGEVVPSFAGSLLSTVKGRARVWRLQTTPLPDSEAQMLAVVLAHGSPLMCSGAVIGSDAVSCYVRGVRTRPTGRLSTLRRMVEFELHEAAPMASPILFRLHASRPLPAGTEFTRASEATTIDRSGVLRTIGPGVPRVTWLDPATPALLLERAATNYITNPTDPAYTTAGTAPVVTPRQDVVLGVPCTVLRVEHTTGAEGGLRITPQSMPAGVACAPSLYFRWLSGDDPQQQVQDSTSASNGDIRIETSLAGEWRRFGPGLAGTQVVTAYHTGAKSNPNLYLRSTSPRVYEIALPQVETGPIATSLILDGERASDVLRLSRVPPPGALASYERWIEGGTITTPGNALRWIIGDSAWSSWGPWWAVYRNVGVYRARLQIGGTTILTPATLPAPQVGQDVEHLASLWWEGDTVHLRLAQRIEGGVAQVAEMSQPGVPPPAAWVADVAYHTAGVPGIDSGRTWIRDWVWLRGSHWTMDAVRRLAG